MERTNFIPRKTLVTAAWLNTVDRVVYNIEESKTLQLASYLNSTATNGVAALAAAIVDANALKITSDERIVINAAGISIGMDAGGATLNNTSNITITGLSLYPNSGTWTDTDVTDAAFWTKYQSVTAAGKTWSQRHALLTIPASGTSGFVLHDFYIDGKGESTTRLAAGIRVKGKTADRKLVTGKIEQVETFGLFIGSDTTNDGAINTYDVEIKPNGRTTFADRTSYGMVLAGNDMHHFGFTSSNSHCPLLVADTGATTFFTDIDLFNGSSFDPGTEYNRICEYWGNSCTLVGGRLGNGVFHIWNKDISIGPLKYGVTEGTTTVPPGYFFFYATKANDDTDNVLLLVSETPIDLKTDIPWFYFVPATGSNSWAVDTTKLGNIKGYVEMIPSAKNYEVKGTNNNIVKRLLTGVEGAYLCFEDKDTTKTTGVGAKGDTLVFMTDEQLRWEVNSSGNLRPLTDNNRNIGSAAQRVAEVYSNKVYIGSGTPYITSGTGSPEGVVTANRGSIFMRTDGGAGTTMYVKETAAGNTGWAAK